MDLINITNKNIEENDLIIDDKYRITGVLCEGSFGKIFDGELVDNEDTKIVVKVEENSKKSKLQNEYEIYKLLVG